MSASAGPQGPSSSSSVARTARVIIVSSVMFTFISYWRTAAVVLCDMSSTVYYIGAVVESAIGKCAPWFILAVLVFSYGMRAVYIESSALFVRGGVYRVVKEALGGFLAKISVSALLFDYVLTGPISGVSAGQYIVGLGLETFGYFTHTHLDEGMKASFKSWGSVLIAIAVTLYFFRQNLRGIHESSDKAMKIMIATTVMGVVLLSWSLFTLFSQGAVNDLPTWKPDLSKKVEVLADGQTVPKINQLTGQQEDPLGFIPDIAPSVAEKLRAPESWLSILGAIGIVLAFGHSILAMSGEETLAQVYREVESPKLPNFKKAAFIVFIYSFLLTGTMNILALVLIPDKARMGEYYDNWMGGLAMQLAGPMGLRLLLNAFVVIVGFLILSGAVNTSIIGSNGVLSRVAEDGVLPDWFLKPNRRYGTSSRILWLITWLQIVTIVLSRGDVIFLGEAYAFGVVWSFVFNTLSMCVLRFKDRTPRPFKVPGNITIRGVEIPLGLMLICFVMCLSAIANLLTKEVATISGAIFTGAFLTVFVTTEKLNARKRRGAKHEHLDQFNQEVQQEVSPANLGLTKPFHKLVAIRSPQNLFMLERALAETDPDTTDVVVMTAKLTPVGETAGIQLDLDTYDQQLMTAVVERAERAGKRVVPLIMPTNNPLHAVLKTAMDLGAQEVIMGASNKFTAEEQLDQLALYWINMHHGNPPGLTVRILSRNRDVYFDLEGGNRIPKIGERKARSVAELRGAGVGADRVLLVHDGSPPSSDLFQSVLTMLDPDVVLDLVTPGTEQTPPINGQKLMHSDRERAGQLGREIEIHYMEGDPARLIRVAREGHYDVIVLPLSEIPGTGNSQSWSELTAYVLQHAHCPVFLAAQPLIPQEVEE